ncbi:MAG TPA: creatininase family protein [Armatimonadota bacterium]|nr:creatininase family protein [Armatimonadota bacterium]
MPAKRTVKKQSLPVRWEELTATDFPAAVKKAKGVCVLPIGVIEKHGPHLPLGTDVMAARAVAVGAAAKEYAVVFPFYYFGQILEAQHEPGCIATRPELLMALLQDMCDEIVRNGFEKIIIVNGHGGNDSWLAFFAQTQLADPRDYVVYIPPRGHMDEKTAKEIRARRKTDWGGHADELESSWMMAIRPDLVKLEYVKREDGRPRRKLKHLGEVHTGIWWYADFPTHYAGDARGANPDLGKLAVKGKVKALAGVIEAVKKDTTAPRLHDEFFAAAVKPVGGRGGAKKR